MPDDEPPIRVGLDAHVVGRRRTGNESYVLGLAVALSDRPDVAVTLYLDRGTAWPLAVPAPRIVSLRQRRPQIRIPFELPIRAARDRLDVLHVQYVAPPISSVPLVTTVHDLSFEDVPWAMPPGRLWRLRATVRYAARRSAVVLTPTAFSRDRLIHHYRVAPDRVMVAPPVVMPSSAGAPEAAGVAARLQLPRSYVLFVGEVQPRKNLPRLIDAVARVRATGVDLGLVVAGLAGWGSPAVADAIAVHGAESWTRLLGYVDHPTLQALYAGARVVGYVSLYEGFGLPVVEGMAAGVPVVTSAVSAIPEVAGGAALLVDPLDTDAVAAAILEAAFDDVTRTRLIDLGRRRAEEFLPAAAIGATVRGYRQALDR